MKGLIVNEIFFAMLEGFYIFLVSSSFLISERKGYISTQKIRILLFVGLYTASSLWITLSFSFGYHTVLLTFLTGLVLSVITKSNIVLSVVATAVSVILIIIIESLMVIILNLVFNISPNNILLDPTIKMRFSIIAKIIQISVGILIFKSNIKPSTKSTNNKANTNLFNYSILGIYMMSVFFVSLNYIIYNPKELIKYEILLFIIFSIYILFGIFDFRERIKMLSIQQKYTLQVEYINNLESIINIIRREKHDFSNHLNSIYAMCILNKENTVERIKNYIGKLADSLMHSYKSFDTGNDYIDGLLLVKSNYAYQNDINLDVEIEAPLYYIDINDNDLISIISNIIDNAFDAITSAEDCDNRAVSLCTYIEDNEYFISIANNGPKIHEDFIPKLFQNGFSTKKNKDEHGLGLFIVNNIVAKNKGKIELHSSDIETQFIIRFAIKDGYNGENCKVADSSYTA